MLFLCDVLGKTLPNGIAVTGAGNLPCRFIIHVDMHKKADWNNTIRAVLLEAASLEVESIAIPAIGTGAVFLCLTSNVKCNILPMLFSISISLTKQ